MSANDIKMVCDANAKRLCSDGKCGKCFNRSFISHEKSKYWSENNEVSPRDVFKSARKKCKFNCDCGHEFEASVGNITKGGWCSYCSNMKLCDDPECIICLEKSFLSHEKSVYWSQNNELEPQNVFKSSHKKYKFNCDCGHEFEAPLHNIVGGTWCSYCNNKKLCNDPDCISCLEKSFAKHEKVVYWSVDNKIDPRDVFMSSGDKYKFDCECGHQFESQLSCIKKGNWCPYCSIPTIKLCSDVNCIQCFEKSFASHEAKKYWSADNKISPREIFKSSKNKYKFDCECGHVFDAELCEINRGNWCPFCSDSPKKLCDKENCIQCFDKSFASMIEKKFWSTKNKINPRQVFKSSNTKHIFDCKCGHEFEIMPAGISMGKWCSYCCTPAQKLCNDKKCICCFQNSFASVFQAKFWSDKNKIVPRQALKSSGKKYKFNCPDCNNLYEAQLCSIYNGRWCGCSIRKTETKLHKFLQLNYDLSINPQASFEWCKKTNCLPFDFCIEEYKLIIELDGPQHFKQISDWKSPEKTQAVDIFKMKSANKHGYSIIRILQEDVWKDNNDWQNKLKKYIKKYDNPTNTFINMSMWNLMNIVHSCEYIECFV